MVVNQNPGIKKNEKGFTLIEILIVFISIVFLVAVVAYTYDGIKARSRNDVRTAELRKLQVYVETFYSQNTYYPSRADLNNPSWRALNLKSFDISSLKDPLWPKNKACDVNGQPILLDTSQTGCFGYAPSNNGVSCEKNDKNCDKYTLTATMENGGGVYRLSQLD